MLLRVPKLDVITAPEVSLSDASDPESTSWAAEQTRIVVTHDRRTMPHHAAARITRGESVAKETVIVRVVPAPQFFTLNEKILAELGITRRELEILELIANGLSNREIAENSLSAKTPSRPIPAACSTS